MISLFYDVEYLVSYEAAVNILIVLQAVICGFICNRYLFDKEHESK